MGEPRKLRIQHIIIQPVVVYDDGEELTPGPELGVVTLPLSRAREMLDQLPDEVAALAERMNATTSGEGFTAP